MKNKTNRPARPTVIRVPVDASDLEMFSALCREDGIKPPKALLVLIRWAIAQGSLCPVHTAAATLSADLAHVHLLLTNALNRVRIEAGHVCDEGEEWKEGGK